jgi:hypothetical protein
VEVVVVMVVEVGVTVEEAGVMVEEAGATAVEAGITSLSQFWMCSYGHCGTAVLDMRLWFCVECVFGNKRLHSQ